MKLAQAISSILFFIFLICGCASVPHQNIKKIDIKSFQDVSIGSTPSDVRLNLGAPQRTLELKKANQVAQELWVYSLSETTGERINIRFSSTNQQVVAKVFAPQEKENESRLDFVLNQTFADEQFAKLSLPRCADYVSPKIIYYNLEKGIFFYYHSLDKLVESIGYSSSEDLKETLERIKKCKPSTYETFEVK